MLLTRGLVKKEEKKIMQVLLFDFLIFKTSHVIIKDRARGEEIGIEDVRKQNDISKDDSKHR